MIKKIALVVYTKNNEEYLKDFLFDVLLKTIEVDLPDFSFHYYFYENDSVDKTVEVLNANVNQRTTIVSETPPPIMYATSATTGREFGRITRMSAIRNRFLDKYRAELSAEYDYVWFLDTDIFVSAEDIARMVNVFENNRDVAMVTCNTLETIDNTMDISKLYNTPTPDIMPFITTKHYYDTYAFISIDNQSYYPSCISPECKYVKCGDNIKAPAHGLLDVRSAWGGCVMLDAKILKEPAIRWNTFSLNGEAPCEHIYFCDMIRAFSKKRIVIAMDISPFWLA